MKSDHLLIITGSGRSGTVYLAAVLKNVYRFGISAEPKFVYEDYRKRYRHIDYDDKLSVLTALRRIYNGKFFNHLRRRKGIQTSFEELKGVVFSKPVSNYQDFITGIFKYVAKVRGFIFPAYKDPLDVKYVGELSSILPKAKFVHIVRDGRDVALSCTKFNWGPTNLYAGARYWSKTVMKGNVAGRALGKDRYLEIRLEDLVLNTDKVSKELDDFVRPIVGESKLNQLQEGFSNTVKKDAINKWQRHLPRESVQLLNAVIGSELRHFRYEVKSDRNPPVLVQRGYYLFLDFLVRSKNRIYRNLTSSNAGN